MSESPFRASLVRRVSQRMFYGWVIVWVAMLGIFASGPAQSHTFSVFIGPIAAELGLSQTAMASAYGLATLVAAFCLPLMGRFLDRVGARRMLSVVALVFGAGCAAFGLAGGMIWLALGFAALRFLGQGSLMLGSSNMVSQWFSQQRGFALGLMALGFAISMAVHPTIAKWLIDLVGWREAWLWLGISTWVLLLPPVLFFVVSKPEDVGLQPDGVPIPADIGGSQAATEADDENDFTLSVSKIKGNSFDLMLSKKFNFNGPRKSVKPTQVRLVSQATNNKLAFYQNILRNLEKDDLFLQSAELQGNDLKLGIVNNKYNDPIKVFEHTKLVVEDLSKDQKIPLSNLSVTTINSGMETGTITAKAINRLNRDKIGYAKIVEPKNDTQDYDFQTILSFPEFYNTIEPEFIYRYADPTRFFAGGIDIQLNSEIKFASDLYLTTAISYQLTNSFERLRYYPDSPYLPHVRTDVVKYLNNRPDLYLNSMQLDKLQKISNGHYLKFSAGMYEMMFGGYGVEYLWKPFESNLSIGVSLYHVKQRDFEQRFRFSDYEVSTGHTNFIYFHPYSGLIMDLSIGKYLAGDKGYTLDLSRRFKSGFKMGAYFTRTNISKIEYGEGSFDKGFYFEMPFSIFGADESKDITKFTVQPLTRDGGAKLKTKNPLIYSISSGSRNDYSYYLD